MLVAGDAGVLGEADTEAAGLTDTDALGLSPGDALGLSLGASVGLGVGVGNGRNTPPVPNNSALSRITTYTTTAAITKTFDTFSLT